MGSRHGDLRPRGQGGGSQEGGAGHRGGGVRGGHWGGMATAMVGYPVVLKRTGWENLGKRWWIETTRNAICFVLEWEF